MFRRSSLSALLLALMLALTSVTEAVARGQSAGITEMVICSAWGVSTVTLDAEGNPVAPSHPCAVCLAATGGALLPAVALPPARPLAAALLWLPPGAGDAASRPAPVALARGPPAVA